MKISEMRNQKILIISGTLPYARCGIGDYTNRLAEAFLDTEIVPIVVTSKDYGKDINSYKVYSVIDNWNKISSITKIVEIAKKEKIKIIHLQWPTVKYYGAVKLIFLPLILKILGFRTVLTLHEYNECTTSYKIKRIPQILFSDRIIVVDPRFVDEINKYTFGLKRKKIEFINIGSNIPESRPSEAKRHELFDGITDIDDEILITHFGFINESKRVDVVLKALGEIKRKKLFKFKYIVLTDLNHSSPEVKSRVLNDIKSNNLDDEVIFKGFLEASKVSEYLSNSDINISLFENGVSPRNSSFIAALAQGGEVITTKPHQKFPYSSPKIHLIDNDVNVLVKTLNNIVTSKSYLEKKNINLPSFKEVANRHIKLYKEISK